MARKTSGNSCGRTGSPIGCSNHSMISSITAAMPGTLSSISPGRSCPSRAAIGQTWVIQCEDWYYICLPPSRNATGGLYQWESGGPQNAALAPPWLIVLAKATKAKVWAKAALERECKAVAAAQPGTRNTTLNTAAFNLFQIVAGRGLDEQEVRDQLFEAAETCRLVADDGAQQVWATINSGAAAGRQQPRYRPQPPPQGARPTIQLMDGQLLRILSETEDALLASGL